MMAVSVESSPDSRSKNPTSFMASSPLFSPSSDRRLWSALRARIDTILENRKPLDQNTGESERLKRMKEDSMLLLRGFDSVSHSLSRLSDNLDIALQGARDLARPPTITEIVHCTMKKEKSKQLESEEGEESEEGKRGLKRKFAAQEFSQAEEDDLQQDTSQRADKQGKMLSKAKNLAISMAAKAASMARELKSIKSDMGFMQERCTLLEEENRRLREGIAKGIRPEEDDLVRLQMEALLAEKSRLANENANLTRENQCLNQLVEYHQLTSQDLSASYEHMMRGICLDFSSPIPPIPEEEDNKDGNGKKDMKTPVQRGVFGLSAYLDECCGEEQ